MPEELFPDAGEPGGSVEPLGGNGGTATTAGPPLAVPEFTVSILADRKNISSASAIA